MSLEIINRTALIGAPLYVQYCKLGRDGLVLRPDLSLAPVEPPPFQYDYWSPQAVAAPKKPTVIGSVDPVTLSAINLHYLGDDFVIKNNDSDLVFLPEEYAGLKNLVQKVLDYEFAANPEKAFRDAAIIMAHTTNPIAGNAHRESASSLHIHRPVLKSKRPRSNTRYYAVSSSQDTTEFYTGAIDIEDIRNCPYIANAEKYPTDYRARAGEITAFTSAHAHKSPNGTGPRLFVLIKFLDRHSHVRFRKPNPMMEYLRGSRPARRERLLQQWTERSRLVSVLGA